MFQKQTANDACRGRDGAHVQIAFLLSLEHHLAAIVRHKTNTFANAEIIFLTRKILKESFALNRKCSCTRFYFCCSKATKRNRFCITSYRSLDVPCTSIAKANRFEKKDVSCVGSCLLGGIRRMKPVISCQSLVKCSILDATSTN